MKDIEAEAMVFLGPFLAAEGQEGRLLNQQAAHVYDAAVNALIALSLNREGPTQDDQDLLANLDYWAEECANKKSKTRHVTISTILAQAATRIRSSLNRVSIADETLEQFLRQARSEGFCAAISAAEARVHYLTARDTLSGHIRALKDEGEDHAIGRLVAALSSTPTPPGEQQ